MTLFFFSRLTTSGFVYLTAGSVLEIPAIVKRISQITLLYMDVALVFGPRNDFISIKNIIINLYHFIINNKKLKLLSNVVLEIKY